MSTKPTRDQHQPETEFNGELQEFYGPALSPDDPQVQARVRRGRPADAERAPATGTDTEAEE